MAGFLDSLVKGLSTLVPPGDPTLDAYNARSDLRDLDKKEAEIYAAIGRAAYAQDGEKRFSEQAEALKQIAAQRQAIQAKLDEAQRQQELKQREQEERERQEFEQPESETAQPDGIVCPKCNASCAAGARFCPSCGEKLAQEPRICTACGAKLSPNSRFCTSCGARVEDSAEQ